jgi:hypothetical protein
MLLHLGVCKVGGIAIGWNDGTLESGLWEEKDDHRVTAAACRGDLHIEDGHDEGCDSRSQGRVVAHGEKQKNEEERKPRIKSLTSVDGSAPSDPPYM